MGCRAFLTGFVDVVMIWIDRARVIDRVGSDMWVGIGVKQAVVGNLHEMPMTSPAI